MIGPNLPKLGFRVDFLAPESAPKKGINDSQNGNQWGIHVKSDRWTMDKQRIRNGPKLGCLCSCSYGWWIASILLSLRLFQTWVLICRKRFSCLVGRASVWFLPRAFWSSLQSTWRLLLSLQWWLAFHCLGSGGLLCPSIVRLSVVAPFSHSL